MKAYLKLVNFELNRVLKLYGMLLILIFLVQSITTIIMSKMYMAERVRYSGEGIMNLSLLDITYSIGFVVPIAITIACVGIYLFFVWYRDWFARNAFIYRLLTLPTSRMNVYFAKLTTIMILVFSLVAYQIMLLHWLNMLVKWVIPIAYRIDLTVMEIMETSTYLNIIAPGGVADFMITYLLGISFVIILFTVVLLERSFRLKGIAFAVLYIVICIGCLLLPVTFYLIGGKMFVKELFIAEMFVVVVIVGSSLWLSRYLLNRKIMV